MSTSMPSTEAQRVHSSSVSKSKAKSPTTDVLTPTPTSASRSHKAPNPLHLLPATALFHGPHSRNASHTSLNRQQTQQRDEPRSQTTPANQDKAQAQQPQHLPRANPPTSSFSSPRPLPLGPTGAVTTPGAGTAFQQLRPPMGTIASSGRAVPFAQSKQAQNDFHPDAVWAEMQRTLADVELSAMNSSHVFGAAHARALEDLRSAQLGLAQAWAKSEADEMGDEEFSKAEESESVVGQLKGGGIGVFGSPTSPSHSRGRGQGHGHGHGQAHGHSRNASTASNASASAGGRKASVGNTLEEETERDIRLARRRREANDRYFKQVNRGVLDVVKKLDEVASAMRRVEKESREIWNESSGSEGEGDGDLGTGTETEGSVKEAGARQKIQKPGKGSEKLRPDAGNSGGGDLVTGADVRTGRPRAETGESLITSGTGTESGFLSDSPQPRR